eukprot:6212868-Pleurochrysis_carterae.AAC.2
MSLANARSIASASSFSAFAHASVSSGYSRHRIAFSITSQQVAYGRCMHACTLFLTRATRASCTTDWSRAHARTHVMPVFFTQHHPLRVRS